MSCVFKKTPYNLRMAIEGYTPQNREGDKRNVQRQTRVQKAPVYAWWWNPSLPEIPRRSTAIQEKLAGIRRDVVAAAHKAALDQRRPGKGIEQKKG